MKISLRALLVTGFVAVLSCSDAGDRGSAIEEGPDMRGTEPAHTNRLANESSPYLLQHANNPVDWYPWGEEAFRKSRNENKPIFLSIGYAACHWCHVMERESFESEEVAALLNRHFVAIKVDREERPDVDEIYMRSVQMLTGSGGWPLSVFLTPELKPFFGGTYFPLEGRFGRPGFKDVLQRVAVVWKERRSDITRDAEGIAAALSKWNVPSPGSPADLGQSATPLLADAAESLARRFDDGWAGFGGAPKFPPSGAIRMLLRHHRHSRDENALRMAASTLEMMARGGMYDQVGGGFHRYSVDERWLVPHFEKMLYDNALLCQAYLEAYQLTGRTMFRRVAREILDYVLREMTDDDGGFHSSEDADSEGREGKYYLWDRSEAMAILGADDGELFSGHYGITERGNFEGRNILNVPQAPAEFAQERGMEEEDLAARLAPFREKLRAVRHERVHPARDDKVLAAWNGMMISALAQGRQVLGEKRFGDAAERTGRFIRTKMVVDGDLVRSYRRGEARHAGYLDDYACVANAFVDLYETSFDVEWLLAADALVRRMMQLFWDDEGKGFFFTSANHKNLLARTKTYTDGAIPSGNSVAVLVLARLAKLVDNPDYLSSARQVLTQAAGAMRSHPGATPYMLCAADFVLSPTREVAVVGVAGSRDTEQMLAAVRGWFLPNKIVVHMDPGAADAAGHAGHVPLLAGKPLLSGRATVYVCEDFACRTPVTTVEELATLLRQK